jgi:hypothetical protein
MSAESERTYVVRERSLRAAADVASLSPPRRMCNKMPRHPRLPRILTRLISPLVQYSKIIEQNRTVTAGGVRRSDKTTRWHTTHTVERIRVETGAALHERRGQPRNHEKAKADADELNDKEERHETPIVGPEVEEPEENEEDEADVQKGLRAGGRPARR